LDAHVWTAVKRALQEPERLVEEWAHRGTADGTTTAMREQHDRAEKAIAATEKVEQRLLDAYEAGLVDLDELQHRMERIRARLVMQRKDLTEVTTELHRTIELTGIITTLQTFGDRIRESLDTASWEQKQRIIRAIVAVVRIDISSATIIYRIPSVAAPGDGSPKEATNRSNPAGPVSPKARLRSGGATGAGKVLLPRQ
jgi:site-specific DNA recombinase